MWLAAARKINGTLRTYNFTRFSCDESCAGNDNGIVDICRRVMFHSGIRETLAVGVCVYCRRVKCIGLTNPHGMTRYCFGGKHGGAD